MEDGIECDLNDPSICAGVGTFKSEYGFMTNRLNNAHIPIYVGGNIIKCETCGVNLTCKVCLEPVIIDEITEVFQCKKCDEILVLKSDLQRHLLIHKEERKKEFKCEECNKCFLWESKLKIHLRVHTGEKPFSCEECNKHYSSKHGLRYHLSTHPDRFPLDFRCIECNKYFIRKSDLKRHEKLHTGEKNFKCGDCNKCFITKFSLRQHQKIHTRETFFICADCNKSFAFKCHLRNHVRIHTGEKPFKCRECSKCFSDPNNYKRHEKTHTGERPFKCKECSKCFSYPNSYKRHVKIHTGEKPFKCRECSKCFSDPNNYKRHEKIHTGVKSFKCEECNKYFARKDILKSHEKIHSRKKPRTFGRRKKFFTSESYIKDFLRKFIMEEKILSLDSAKDTSGEKGENISQEPTEYEVRIEDNRVEQDSMQQVSNPQKEIEKEENSVQQLTENEVLIKDEQIQQDSTQEVSSPQKENAKGQSGFEVENAPEEDISQPSGENKIRFIEQNIDQDIEEDIEQVISPEKEIAEVISQSSFSLNQEWTDFILDGKNLGILEQVIRKVKKKNMKKEEKRKTRVLNQSLLSQSAKENGAIGEFGIEHWQKDSIASESEGRFVNKQFQQLSTEQISSRREKIANVKSQSPFSLSQEWMDFFRDGTNLEMLKQTIQKVKRKNLKKLEKREQWMVRRNILSQPTEENDDLQDQFELENVTQEDISQRSAENKYLFGNNQLQKEIGQVSGPEKKIANVISRSSFSLSQEWIDFFMDRTNLEILQQAIQKAKKEERKNQEKSEKWIVKKIILSRPLHLSANHSRYQ